VNQDELILKSYEISDCLEALRIKLGFTWLGNVPTVAKYDAIAKTQLRKAIPIIEAEARKAERKRVLGEVEIALGVKNNFGVVHTEYCSWESWQALKGEGDER